MAKFTARPDLDEVVAREFAAPEVTDVAKDAMGEARRLAPATKTWTSMGDGGVREQHVRAHGQVRPDNLRFELDSYEYDVRKPRPVATTSRKGDGSGWDGPKAKMAAGHHTYLREPRDGSAHALVAVVNCRCFLVRDPQGIARLVRRTPTTVTGTLAKSTVYVEGDYMIQVEFGDRYPRADGEVMDEEGTLFMHTAAMNTAARRNRLRPRR